MTNPFTTVFREEVGSYQLSADTVTISLEEYEHLLLRVATAEQKYWEVKQLLEVK